MDISAWILMGIVLLSFTSQALAGFGCIIIAVALGSFLYPIKTLLPILVPLDVLVNGYIVARYRSKVDVPFLTRKIFPAMVVGFIGGIVLFGYLNSAALKGIFGAFVVVISFRELWLMLRRSELRPLSPVSQAAYLLLGGFIQGVFASGGPPVVYAVSRSITDKTVIRSTLCALWMTINSILVVTYVIAGQLTAETVKHSALMLPAIAGGLLIGEFLHRYIDERHFKIVIFCILIVAGTAILSTSIQMH